MASNALPDSDIEELLFLQPPDGSEYELEDLNLDELWCNSENVLCMSDFDDTVDTELPNLDQNIFVPDCGLDPSETSSISPIVIVVPHSEFRSLELPSPTNIVSTETVGHSPSFKTYATKRHKYCPIKSVVWKKEPFLLMKLNLKVILLFPMTLFMI